MSKSKTPKNTTSLAPVIAIFLFTAGYIATAYMTLDAESRHVPLLTGYVTIFLLVFETLKRFVPWMKPTGEERGSEPPQVEVTVPLSRELIGLGYVAALALGIYVFGFFVALPVYLFAAVAWLGQQNRRTALTVAIVSSIAIYVIFQLILETRLFPGILFD